MISSGDDFTSTKNTPRLPRRDDRTQSWPFIDPGFWVAAIVGALVSLIITGYAFPISNNSFHLPIVGQLYDNPNFVSDAYIQSLRHFSSGIWWILAGSADWVEPRNLFFAALLLSRLLSFVGFLVCANHFGIQGAKHRFIFALLISMSPLMQGESFAGDGGLFINYFTHSEIANGLFLLAVWAGLQLKIPLALSMMGLTFFVNAFIGVWLAFILGALFAYEALMGRLVLKHLTVSSLLGAVICVSFTIPIIFSIVSNPDFGKPLHFNYVDFLTEYYPTHFLAWTIPFRDFVRLAIVATIGVAALSRLPDGEGRFAIILGACLLLYVIGVCIPWVNQSSLVLNLHLLRSGTLIHLLSALLLSTVLVRWWLSADIIRMGAALGIAVILSMMLIASRGHTLIYLAIIGVVAFNGGSDFTWIQRRVAPPVARYMGLLTACTWILAVLFVAIYSLRNQRIIADHEHFLKDWGEIANWAQQETESSSIFLVDGEASADFEYLSHRSIWVDWKRGAAVMWSPSYYGTWKERRDDVAGLNTLDERIVYSRSHKIAYIIEPSIADCQGREIFRTVSLCVVEVK